VPFCRYFRRQGIGGDSVVKTVFLFRRGYTGHLHGSLLTVQRRWVSKWFCNVCNKPWEIIISQHGLTAKAKPWMSYIMAD
jgi:hypothetical protein